VVCRHDEAAAKAIVDGMAWLGVKHDGEIVRQSSRKARHQEVVQEMLAKGTAFKCYCSKEELEALRAEAEKNKVPFRYPGTWRPENAAGKVPPQGIEPVVRICTAQEGTTGWDDQVQGRIDFPNKDLDDFILLRADGSPTYLLAVVVDDHDMEISHVIRGTYLSAYYSIRVRMLPYTCAHTTTHAQAPTTFRTRLGSCRSTRHAIHARGRCLRAGRVLFCLIEPEVLAALLNRGDVAGMRVDAA
jgi:hypothetical protein